MFRLSRSVTFTVHTARVPAPQNHSHHNQCRTPNAAADTLVLLMMGIIMPETCRDKSLIINIRLVASCWFLSLHPIVFYSSTFTTMHGPINIRNKINFSAPTVTKEAAFQASFVTQKLYLRSKTNLHNVSLWKGA